MYTSERIRKRLAAGEILFGLAHHYPSTAVLESMGGGWDFVWVDAQHGQHSYESALEAVRVAQGMGLDTLLRVDSRDPDVLGKYADTGSSALMIPMVNNAAQAETIVSALRYPPAGDRSYASRRLVDLVGADYHLKPAPLVVAQVETPGAIEQAEPIASTHGVDALFFSPDDLRLRMNIPHDRAVDQSDALLDAMRRTATAARRAGKAAGCPAPNPALVKIAAEMGYQLLIGGSDAGFVRVGAAERLRQLKPAAVRDRGTDA